MTADGRADDDLGWLASDGAVAETLAVIWATVDIERAMREVGDGDRAAGGARKATRDELLGALVVVVGRPGADSVAFAEPDTEGRIAATLARHGEGPAGRYVSAPEGFAAVRRRASEAGVAISRPGQGPFGASILVLGPASGPHTLIVDRPAVPSRP